MSYKWKLTSLFLQLTGTHLSRRFPRMVVTRWKTIFPCAIEKFLKVPKILPSVSFLRFCFFRFLILHTLPILTVSEESVSKLDLVYISLSFCLWLICCLFPFYLLMSYVDGSSGSDRNNSEPERKPKLAPPRNEALTKPIKKSVPASSSAPHNVQVSSLCIYVCLKEAEQEHPK